MLNICCARIWPLLLYTLPAVRLLIIVSMTGTPYQVLAGVGTYLAASTSTLCTLACIILAFATTSYLMHYERESSGNHVRQVPTSCWLHLPACFRGTAAAQRPITSSCPGRPFLLLLVEVSALLASVRMHAFKPKGGGLASCVSLLHHGTGLPSRPSRGCHRWR